MLHTPRRSLFVKTFAFASLLAVSGLVAQGSGQDYDPSDAVECAADCHQAAQEAWFEHGDDEQAMGDAIACSLNCG